MLGLSGVPLDLCDQLVAGTLGNRQCTQALDLASMVLCHPTARRDVILDPLHLHLVDPIRGHFFHRGVALHGVDLVGRPVDRPEPLGPREEVASGLRGSSFGSTRTGTGIGGGSAWDIALGTSTPRTCGSTWDIALGTST